MPEVLYHPLTGAFTRDGIGAGTINGEGYAQIKIDGRLYLAHRLAWRIMTGYWPENDIDHRNKDRRDNRFVNLREATGSQNLRNRGKPKNNTSGFKGVSWNSGRHAWLATIHDGAKNKNLGYFATRESAAKAYDRAALRYHGEFASINFPQPQRRNTMYDSNEDIIMMPVPRAQFSAVCALLGGASLAALSTPVPKQPAPIADKPAEEVVQPVETVADGTLDAAGWPWSEALHASTKGTTKDGLWRMKVGVSRPDPKPGFPKEAPTGGTGTTSGGTELPASGTAAGPAAGEDEDEFAAFRAAADAANGVNTAAAAAVPARKWTDADLGALCNQAAVKLGDPTPIKVIISEFVPEGQVPHSRNIPDDKREDFAKAIEAKAGITFAAG